MARLRGLSTARLVAAYAVISVLVNVLFLGVQQWYFYDAQKYRVSADAMLAGTFSVDEQPIENAPGYPALLAGSRVVGDALGVGEGLVLETTQLLLAIGIDLLVVFVVAQLTTRRWIWMLAGLFSVTSVMTKAYTTTTMTEVLYICGLMGFLALAVMALRRESAVWVVAAAAAAALLAWVRPSAGPLWLFALGVWVVRELWRARAGGEGAPGLLRWLRAPPRRLERVAATVVAAAIAVFLIGLPVKREGIGTHERLSVLWYGAVQQNDDLFEEFRKTAGFQSYRRTYLSWLRSFSRPPMTRLEPAWVDPAGRGWRMRNTADPRWGLDRNLRWWKAPPWILMAQRGYSYPRALRWQADTALALVAAGPADYANGVLDTLALTAVHQPVAPRYAAEATHWALGVGIYNPLTAPALHVLETVNRFNRAFYGSRETRWSARPAVYWSLLIIFGMLAGFRHFGRWEYALVLAVVLFHVLVSPALAGIQARYRIPMEIFSGLFLAAAGLTLWRWACVPYRLVSRLRARDPAVDAVGTLELEATPSGSQAEPDPSEEAGLRGGSEPTGSETSASASSARPGCQEGPGRSPGSS
jgi:hypothetical protein